MRINNGRTKANATAAAAFIPQVSENISIHSPNIKASSINTCLEVPEFSFSKSQI